MKKLNFLFVILTLLTLAIFGVFFLIPSHMVYSKEEGRNLIEKPKVNWTSKKNLEALEKYYQDHFLFRNIILEEAVHIKQNLGINIQNGVYLGDDECLFLQPKEVQKSNELIKNINDFYKKYNSINMSLILVPSHVVVNPEKAPKNVSIFDEYHQMKSIYHQLTINTIDVVPILKEGLKEYPMYYRLDTNLTSYGAYYIYKTYAKLNDLNDIPMTSFEVEEVSNQFSGNLVKKAHTFSYKKDTVVRFIPKKEALLEVLYENRKETTLYNEKATEDNFYEYFLKIGEPIIEITNSSIDNQKEILILKDESANVMIPFFVNQYYKVHVIDTNHYDKSVSGYLDTHREIKDVVLIYQMNGLDDQIENLAL